MTGPSVYEARGLIEVEDEGKEGEPFRWKSRKREGWRGRVRERVADLARWIQERRRVRHRGGEMQDKERKSKNDRRHAIAARQKAIQNQLTGLADPTMGPVRMGLVDESNALMQENIEVENRLDTAVLPWRDALLAELRRWYQRNEPEGRIEDAVTIANRLSNAHLRGESPRAIEAMREEYQQAKHWKHCYDLYESLYRRVRNFHRRTEPRVELEMESAKALRGLEQEMKVEHGMLAKLMAAVA